MIWKSNDMLFIILEWFLKDERFVDNTDEIINWINLNKWIKMVKIKLNKWVIEEMDVWTNECIYI